MLPDWEGAGGKQYILWKGMETIAGIKNDRNSKVTRESYRCDNKLYLRFETHK